MARPDASEARLDELKRRATASTTETYEVIRALLNIATTTDPNQERALAAAEARAIRAEAQVAKLETRLAEARAATEDATEALVEAVAECARLRASAGEPERLQPAAASSAEAPSRTGGPSEPLAEVFRSWCRSRGAIVGKPSFFAAHVAEALPGTTLTVVYRDGHAQATPVVLNPSGGTLPVEYWAVAFGGRHWLLPQPLSGSQFRELDPCFEGEATPEALRDFRPAELRAAGGGFELVRHGRASA